MKIHLTKVVPSGPVEAYEAFLQPASMSEWFTTQADADLRIGGRYSNADGDQGEFLVLEPGVRAAFTWDNPKHCPGTRVDITFTEQSDGTTVIELVHSGLVNEEHRISMTEGWSWALDSFESYMRTGKPITFEAWKADRSSSV
jgi:uncharacterized protein YndB with AHSA1/START domain